MEPFDCDERRLDGVEAGTRVCRLFAIVGDSRCKPKYSFYRLAITGADFLLRRPHKSLMRCIGSDIIMRYNE